MPNEIDDDSFWAEFRQVVKQANPHAYLLGEIWATDPRWVGPDHFDGLMNYPLRDALIELIVMNKLPVDTFIKELRSLMKAYPRENSYAHYVPLGSHDTPRLLTVVKGDQRKLRLFYLMLFCFPGAPAIYYGDEVGLKGGKDPDCRRAFPWDEEHWDHDLRNFIQRLIALRRKTASLRRGDVNFIACPTAGIVAMARTLRASSTLVVFNSTEKSIDFRLPVGEIGWSESEPIINLLSKEVYIVSEGQISLQLSSYQGLILGKQKGEV